MGALKSLICLVWLFAVSCSETVLIAFKILTIHYFNSTPFSSPDLKNLEVRQEYRHLRAISNGKTGQDHCSEPDTGSGSDGSGWGSADELEVNVLKTFQRPLRPAAASRKSNVPKVERQNQKKSEKKRTTLRQKRDRNKSNISDIQLRVGTTPQDSSCGDNNFSDTSYLTNNSSSYSKKHESEDNPLSQPLQHLSGFQSSMAMEAARAAMAFKNGQNDEEIIGTGSDSD